MFGCYKSNEKEFIKDIFFSDMVLVLWRLRSYTERVAVRVKLL